MNASSNGPRIIYALVTAIALSSWLPDARATWTLDLGGSFDFVQNESNGLTATGDSLSGFAGLFYFFTPRMGMGVVYEGHGFEATSKNAASFTPGGSDAAGSGSTAAVHGSLIYHGGARRDSPYLFLNVGSNSNKFSPTRGFCSSFGTANCTVPGNTSTGMKFGVGLPGCAGKGMPEEGVCWAQFELAYWRNEATFDVQNASGARIGSFDANLSGFLMSLRIRFGLW